MSRFEATVENGRAIPERPSRILVPVDFSPESSAALRYAVTLARQSRGIIDVLHVWNSQSMTGNGLVSSRISGDGSSTVAELVHDEATGQMQRFLEPYDNDPGVVGHVASGDPLVMLPELSKRYDLLVMGRGETDSLRELFLGSASAQVIAEAKCAVITVREIVVDAAE